MVQALKSTYDPLFEEHDLFEASGSVHEGVSGEIYPFACAGPMTNGEFSYLVLVHI